MLLMLDIIPCNEINFLYREQNGEIFMIVWPQNTLFSPELVLNVNQYTSVFMFLSKCLVSIFHRRRLWYCHTDELWSEARAHV